MSRPTGNTPWPQRARSLGPRQYAPDGRASTKAEQPIPVRVWVITVGGDDLELEGEAMEWTSRAVRVRYRDKYGHDDWVWVWAGAVARV